MKKLIYSLSAIAFASLASNAHAQSTQTYTAPADDAAGDAASDDIVVLGRGETRSVSAVLPANLETLPPGTSAQKALNFLPGVSAQSIDALGVNEQSMSLQVRGFNTTHLGYTLDDIPLGDGAYNNYNGLSISRALISENLARAELATGIAGLGIASTSNLGGAVTYFSSAPRSDIGLRVSQGFGSDDAMRTFIRFDTGEHDGFSAFLSGQYMRQDLFVRQLAGNRSTGRQFNGKLQYRFNGGTISAFVDVSRTNQPSDTYMSQEMLSRLGWDWGGIAPNWQGYVNNAYCTVTNPTAVAQCVRPAAPVKASDISYTNGQILRDDELYYLTGDFNLTDSLSTRLQVYLHNNKGAGNNFIVGWSNRNTPSTADDVPVSIRDTRYTIDRNGILASVTWEHGVNRLRAGFWLEDNTSSAARYIWTNITGPSNLGRYLKGQPNTAQWVQETTWRTRQFYVEDTISLLDDTLSIELGFKGTYSRSNAAALPGISVTPPPASSQFATGSLTAEDYFLPQVGVRWEVSPGHELFASYSENMAMYQGGFKLGPQSVSQAVWNAQGATLRPETSRSFDGGYRYVGGQVQLSVSAYYVQFDNRLLQYNPCPTNLQQNPGCGNSFHNADRVISRGLEIGLLWKPMPWLNWYNSASFNRTTYDDDLNWCTTTCTVYDTDSRQQVDTPKTLLSSVVTAQSGGFSVSLMGKYTGRRYYTYTNDRSFGPVTTFDLGLAYDFGILGFLKNAKASLNITNLTNKRYATNFDNSVFAPSDPTGSILVMHSSAPRQVFGTLSFAF